MEKISRGVSPGLAAVVEATAVAGGVVGGISVRRVILPYTIEKYAADNGITREQINYGTIQRYEQEQTKMDNALLLAGVETFALIFLMGYVIHSYRAGRL